MARQHLKKTEDYLRENEQTVPQQTTKTTIGKRTMNTQVHDHPPEGFFFNITAKQYALGIATLAISVVMVAASMIVYLNTNYVQHQDFSELKTLITKEHLEIQSAPLQLRRDILTTKKNKTPDDLMELQIIKEHLDDLK